MRLTLRTLLAYMDDILDPGDHEALGKKIEASDFSTELIHRSRDTVRRLRLGAPKVSASDGDDVLDSDMSDANSVAEYLDNTLSPESVAEFERMCLEQGNVGDMHLAEVTSCHHVLTMVLGEPAEIDAELRQRMYMLPDRVAMGQKIRIEPSHTPSQQPASPPAPVSAPPLTVPADSNETELPDYLRAAVLSKRRTKRAAVLAALLAVAGIAGWLASGVFTEPEVSQEVAALDLEDLTGDFQFDVEIPTGDPGDSKFNDTAPELPGTSGETLPSTAPPFDPSTPTSVDHPPPLIAQSETSSADDLGQVPAFVPEDSATESDDSEILATSDIDTELPLVPGHTDIIGDSELVESTASSVMPDELSSIRIDSSVEAVVEEPGVESGSDRQPLDVASSQGTLTSPDAPDVPTVPEPSGLVRLGGYPGNNDVLLRYLEDQQKWIRLPPRSPLASGDSLLSLPKFRTHVVLANVNAYLSGGTRLHLLDYVSNGASTSGGNSNGGGFRVGGVAADLELEVVYGRLLLVAGLKGSRVALRIGEERHEWQLNGSASLAVEVRRLFVPGTDYETQSSPIEVTWYLTSGSVTRLGVDGPEQTLEGSVTWKRVAGIDESVSAIAELPRWIDRDPATESERQMAEVLAAGKPVGITLLELMDGKGLGRRFEVRSLAAESSVHVGEFEPFVKALNDSKQHRSWDEQIETLREAIARSPHVAGRVREAFVNLRGESAAQELMEMVSGYDQQAIGTTAQARQEGALAQLIRWLDSDSLDYRVLAIHNLNIITGTSYLEGYRPDVPSKRRQIAIRKIWDRLDSNDLVHQQ